MDPQAAPLASRGCSARPSPEWMYAAVVFHLDLPPETHRTVDPRPTIAPARDIPERCHPRREHKRTAGDCLRFAEVPGMTTARAIHLYAELPQANESWADR